MVYTVVYDGIYFGSFPQKDIGLAKLWSGDILDTWWESRTAGCGIRRRLQGVSLIHFYKLQHLKIIWARFQIFQVFHGTKVFKATVI